MLHLSQVPPSQALHRSMRPTPGQTLHKTPVIAIRGQHLVPTNTPSLDMNWSSAPEFTAGLMPTQLGGVSVKINNKLAYVDFYCSEVSSKICVNDQINVLTPLDNVTGAVQVTVTNGTQVGTPFVVNMRSVAPSLLWFNPKGYVVATHSNYALLGPTSLYPGLSTPAKAGEAIILYGVGFGLPTTSLIDGSAIQSGALSVYPVCTIGGVQAPLSFAGLISPGLYQLNLLVPSSAKDGDNAVSCIYGGSATPLGLITIAGPA